MSMKRTRFLSTQALDDAMAEAVRRAREAGVPLAAVGGYAMSFYGSDRMTADLDLAVRHTLGLTREAALTFGGIRTHIGSVPVDLINRADDYANLYDEAVQYAREAPEGVAGARVASPEHMVALKLAAGPRDDKDLPDLRYLLTQPGLLDYDKARRIVRRHLGTYGAETLDAIRAEAVWLATRRSS